jgi:hypothetical protein
MLATAAINMAALSACGGGSATSYSDLSPTPVLAVVGNHSIALGGSEVITINMQNFEYMTDSVQVRVSNSDNSTASMIENNCNQSQLTKDSPQCTITLSGTRLGDSRITVSAIGYQPLIHDVSVLHQWGGLGGGTPYFVNEVDVVEDTIYASTYDMVYKSESGSAWQVVGGGELSKPDMLIAVEDNAVCSVDQEAAPPYGVSTFVGCSKNSSNWYDLPPQLYHYAPRAASISEGNLYLIVKDLANFVTIIESCPINNCISWQQQGESTPIWGDGLVDYLYNKTPYIQQHGNLYYQNNSGIWQLYGTYIPGIANNHFAFSPAGAVFLPSDNNTVPPYTQRVYYLDSSNIGESFTEIGNGITINTFSHDISYSPIVFHNNTVYANLEDGKIYTATKTGNTWSAWQQVGDSPYPLYNVAISPDGKKLYSIVSENGIDSKVYVYSL